MDTHVSGEGGDEADWESTSETELTNETAASPRAESDEVISCSTPETSDNLVSDIHSHSDLVKGLNMKYVNNVPVKSQSCDSRSRSHDPISPLENFGIPFGLNSPISENNLLASSTLLSGSWYEDTPTIHTHNLAHAVDNPADNSSVERESTRRTSLRIPLHIQRPTSPERKNESKDVCGIVFAFICLHASTIPLVHFLYLSTLYRVNPLPCQLCLDFWYAHLGGQWLGVDRGLDSENN